MLKKLLIVAGVIVGLFVLAAIVVPLFFDANKYRPQIEKLVEDNVNADLQLGKLKLSLWGGVNINVEKLVLSEKGSQGARPILAFKDFSLEVSLVSIFTGHPDILVAVKNPFINIVSEKDGKLNVSKIAKSSTPTQPPSQSGSKSKSSGGAMPFELSFHLVEGTVVYADEIKNTKTQINGINFDLQKFGLNRPFTFSFDSDLDSKEMKDLIVHGRASFSGRAAIYMADGGLKKAEFQTDIDLSKLVIKYSTLLNKTEKAPLKINVKLVSTDKLLNLDQLHIQLNDAAVNISGTVANFSKPMVEMTIVGSKFNLEQWQEVLLPLKEYGLKGLASFNMKVFGPASKIEFAGDGKLESVSLKAPGLVPPITDLNSTLRISTDFASIVKTTLKMGDSDLYVNGSVKNFAKPFARVAIESRVLDVDSLLPQKTPEQEKAAEEKENTSSSAATTNSKAASNPLQAFKSNPAVRDMDFSADMKVGKLIIHKAALTDVKAQLTFKNFVMALKDVSAKAFSGTGAVNATIDFKGADPTYVAGGQVSNIDVNAAISNQMPVAKDSLFGKAFAKFNINGSGLSKSKVTNSLNGKGSFRLENGSWSALKAMQQVGSALRKIPGAQSAIGNINVSDKFKELHSDFTIASGKLNIVNMIAEMDGARTGITGTGYVDFDMNMDLNGKIAVAAGPDIPRDLKGADGRLTLPYEIACKANSPCLKMDAAMKLVATAYAKKVGGDALKKAIENNTDNQAVKDLLKKLPF